MLPLKQCSRAAQQRMVLAHAGYGGDSGSRLILPGQPQRRSGGGTPKLIIPGQQRQAPPQMPPGQANFPELAQQGDMGQITTAAPRNFRPPPGAPLALVPHLSHCTTHATTATADGNAV